MEPKPKPTGSSASMVWERISIDNASPDNIRYRLVKVFQSRDILWHPKHTSTDQAALHRAWKEVVKFTNIQGLTVKNAKMMIRDIVDKCQNSEVKNPYSPEWLRLAAEFLTKNPEVHVNNDQPVKQKEIVICRACLCEYEKDDDRILPLISTYINRVLLADIYRELVGEDETISHTFVCCTCKNILLDFRAFRRKCHENSPKFQIIEPVLPDKPVPPIDDESPDEAEEEEEESVSSTLDFDSDSVSTNSEEEHSAPDENGDDEMMPNGDHDSEDDDADSDSNETLKPTISSGLRQICPICGKLRYLRDHMQIHNTSRPFYYCDHCNRCYTNKTSLKDHILSQHMDRTYTCQYCEKTLKSPSGLQKHLEIYHFKQTLPCPICSKMFGSVKRLREHLRTIHITKQPVQCSECPKKFTTKAALFQHRQSHHADLELPCVYCERVFGSKSYLQRHIQRCHTNEMNGNQCPVCMLCFALNATMRMHVLKMHPEYKLLPKGTVMNARALERSARAHEQHNFEKVKNVWKKIS